jgi:UDP-N-acetylglucosamine diphosphorylase / glucose-1-phosphate thymidylyltransferase / UDP-N-acetylgalactosamine diphosphorylase / glucosamine-1-phosphate N-acetyltransferase / galactosamine-1-phosphate N-acetyltransferase
MQAVIMAAGLGTRMRPVTYKTPKGMLEIKGRPLLEWTFDFLPEEITEVIITVNHLGDQIKNHFGEEWKGRKVKYVFQKELNGTGGSIDACKDYLSDKFIVVNGDDLFYKKDLEKLCQEDLAILAYEVEDPSKYGVFKLDKEGHLIDVIERPKTKEFRLINIGAYALNKKFFDYDLVRITETEFGLPQTLAKMTDKYKVKVIPATHWFPVGCPEDLEKAQTEIEKFL